MTNRHRLRHLRFWVTFLLAIFVLMLLLLMPSTRWVRVAGIEILLALSILYSVWTRSRHSFLWSPRFWWRWRRFRRMPPAGFCKRCGYNLTGNITGVCPECGVVCKAAIG